MIPRRPLPESHLDKEDRAAKAFHSHRHFCTGDVMTRRNEFARAVIKSRAVEKICRILEMCMEMVCCRSVFLSVG